MKARLLTLFALLALLLVSTAVLADGRPSGIRITRAANGGANNVEIDVSVNTYTAWGSSFLSTVLIGNAWGNTTVGFYHYASPSFSVPLPWAIDWGDGYYVGSAPLFGPPGGPYRGTFAHTYLSPGSYTLTVGDAAGVGSIYAYNLTTGNPIYASGGIYWGYELPGGTFDTVTFSATTGPPLVALTANTALFIGGIPTTNTYGLIALALLLGGTGLLVFRKPHQTVA